MLQDQTNSAGTGGNIGMNPTYPQTPEHVCPHCGRCRHCGQGAQHPYYPQPIWIGTPYTAPVGGLGQAITVGNMTSGTTGLQAWN
jgi:hypothetical protein